MSELLFVNTNSVLVPDNQQHRKAKIMNIKPTHGNLMNACLDGRVKGVLVALQKQTSELSSPLLLNKVAICALTQQNGLIFMVNT